MRNANCLIALEGKAQTWVERRLVQIGLQDKSAILHNKITQINRAHHKSHAYINLSLY